MAQAHRNPEDLLPLTPATFLILLAIARGVRHGYAVMSEVERITRTRTTLGPGTLYRTIQRMLLDGLISEGEEPSEKQAERRRYYQLTEFGRQVGILEAERHADLLKAAMAGELLGDGVPAAARRPRKRVSR